MPSGRKGVTKDFVKQAYQRARRLVKGPVRGLTGSDNPALNRFLKSMAAVNKNSKMSKQYKTETRQQIAKAFLESEYSMKSNIVTQYNKEVSRLNQRTREAIQGDANLMAKYLEGNKNQKIALVAEYYLDSDQFKTAHMRVLKEGLNKQNFYDFINEATIDKTLSPDISNAELNAAIMDYRPLRD